MTTNAKLAADTVKLNKDDRAMLERLRAGPALAGHWDFSGCRVPDKLRRAGLIERCDHPTVVDRRFGYPADAYRLTEAGALLAERLT